MPHLRPEAFINEMFGIITFSGNPVLKQIGTRITFLSVGFENKDGMDIQYKAGLGTMSVSGTFNLEKLITSCSGLLCNAARALKNQRPERNRALEEIMGRQTNVEKILSHCSACAKWMC
jgi:hypothetical protein